MPGRHSSHPWRDLGLIRGLVAAVGLFLMEIVRFLREGPEWLIGLFITVVALAIFLLVAQ